MFKYSLSFLCWTICIITYAQDNPKDYNAFKGKKEVVFYDNFDDDRNKWFEESYSPASSKLDKDSCEYYIKDGVLFQHYTAEEDRQFSACEILKNIDYNRNFELSFNAKISGHPKRLNTGIIYWGREQGTLNGYNMYFGQDKSIFIFYSDTQLKDSVHNKASKRMHAKNIYYYNSFNMYTIRKYEDMYYVFINGAYYRKLIALPLTGKVIGLGSSFNATTVFDNISISYLP